MATYLVIGPGDDERIVEAANQAQARNHAARNAFKVSVATPHDVARVVKAGGDIETAGDEPATEPAAHADLPPVEGATLGERGEGGPQEVKPPKK